MTSSELLREPRSALPHLDVAARPGGDTPRLSPDVAVHDDPVDASRIIIAAPSGRMFRVSAAVAPLMHALSVERPAPLSDIALELGAPWDEANAEEALRQFDAMGLLATGEDTPETERRGRLQVQSPLVMRFAIADPSRLLGWARRWPWLVRSRGARGAALALVITGLMPMMHLVGQADGPLQAQISLTAALVVGLMLFATVAVHELAHGAALMAEGGRPRRIGVMLFYFAPGLYCDITDAWRLVPPARVRVALAGCLVQGAIAGAAAIAAVAGVASQSLGLYALLSYTMVALNLLPFVKLDGYLAVAGHADRGNLRREAKQAVAVRLAALLGASNGPMSEGAPPPGLLAFGIGAWLAPMVLVYFGLAAIVSVLATSLGTAGAAGALALVVAVAIAVATALVRRVRALVRLRPAPLRVAAAGLLIALVAAACSLPQASTRSARGGVVAVDGDAYVVALPAGLAGDALEHGRGTLGSAGPVFVASGRTVVPAGPVSACTATVSAIAPIAEDESPVAASCLRVHIPGPDRSVLGSGVRFRLGPASPVAAAADRFVGLPWRMLARAHSNSGRRMYGALDQGGSR